MTLNDFFIENPKVALAFSGGADSAYLLYAGLKAGAEVHAYYIKTPFQPAFELKDAERLAKELEAPLSVIELDVLADESIFQNPENRCYHCKRVLFGALSERARADGFSLIIDGTNASDDAADRPGMRALSELNVRSPLRGCGITKPELRALSREAGLFTWNKPAYACLATRVPTGTPISQEILSKIEGAEDALFALGFSDFRVRYFDGREKTAKIELKNEQFLSAFEQKNAILNAFSPFFDDVFLDLKGRE